MNELELRSKIELVIESITKKNLKIENNLLSSSINNNLTNRQYQLDKYSYFLTKNRNKIKRGDLYIERLNNYLNYLDAIATNSEINIKMKEYNFIRIIQKEAFFCLNSEIDMLNQKRILNMNYGLEFKETSEIKKQEKNLEKIRKIFLNGKFEFEQEKIYTTEYLDYDILKVVEKIYTKDKSKSKK